MPNTHLALVHKVSMAEIKTYLLLHSWRCFLGPGSSDDDETDEVHSEHEAAHPPAGGRSLRLLKCYRAAMNSEANLPSGGVRTLHPNRYFRRALSHVGRIALLLESHATTLWQALYDADGGHGLASVMQRYSTAFTTFFPQRYSQIEANPRETVSVS